MDNSVLKWSEWVCEWKFEWVNEWQLWMKQNKKGFEEVSLINYLGSDQLILQLIVYLQFKNGIIERGVDDLINGYHCKLQVSNFSNYLIRA